MQLLGGSTGSPLVEPCWLPASGGYPGRQRLVIGRLRRSDAIQSALGWCSGTVPACTTPWDLGSIHAFFSFFSFFLFFLFFSFFSVVHCVCTTAPLPRQRGIACTHTSHNHVSLTVRWRGGGAGGRLGCMISWIRRRPNMARALWAALWGALWGRCGPMWRWCVC